ncbi:MAG: sel1 repeat family protein, partial [Betaproteobacteria bacterium]|nr:sel1 repeat family protein [Betaproteobacteria bacterium]
MGDTAEASKPNPPSRHVAHLESTKLMTRTAPLATKLALALFTAASLGGAWPALANKPALPSAAPASTAQAPGVNNLEIGVAALQRGHHATALRAWRAAADQGNVKAQTNIGYLHEHGLGVPQSYVEAMAWYRKAAAQNEPTAQFNIGTLYAYGYGVERNPREA